MLDHCRFAPSTTGHAHPGTLLAALLAWLDARSRGASLVLRLEDIDPKRTRAQYSLGLRQDLAWLGLDFDAVVEQHQRTERHHAALDRLERLGLLYPCSCSRAQLRACNLRALDGGFVYPGTCRHRSLSTAGWRASREPLRFRLPDHELHVADEGGGDLSQSPSVVMGDPVVRRRDGAIAYQLAVVVDDADDGITRVVRGKDIAPSTATQVALQQALGLPTPVYRHHLLLLEPAGNKLAKLHGSVGLNELRPHYQAPQLVAFLARAAGLCETSQAVTPRELLPDFAWSRVAIEDRLVRWDGESLTLAAR